MDLSIQRYEQKEISVFGKVVTGPMNPVNSLQFNEEDEDEDEDEEEEDFGAARSPCLTLRPDRSQMGGGSSPCSLSRAGIGRLIGCQLPDAILHGKRSLLRPRSRAVQRFAVAELLSEAFQLAWTDGGATGLRTRRRHICVFFVRVSTT